MISSRWRNSQIELIRFPWKLRQIRKPTLMELIKIGDSYDWLIPSCLLSRKVSISIILFLIHLKLIYHLLRIKKDKKLFFFEELNKWNEMNWAYYDLKRMYTLQSYFPSYVSLFFVLVFATRSWPIALLFHLQDWRTNFCYFYIRRPLRRSNLFMFFLTVGLVRASTYNRINKLSVNISSYFDLEQEIHVQFSILFGFCLSNFVNNYNPTSWTIYVKIIICKSIWRIFLFA